MFGRVLSLFVADRSDVDRDERVSDWVDAVGGGAFGGFLGGLLEGFGRFGVGFGDWIGWLLRVISLGWDLVVYCWLSLNIRIWKFFLSFCQFIIKTYHTRSLSIRSIMGLTINTFLNMNLFRVIN